MMKVGGELESIKSTRGRLGEQELSGLAPAAETEQYIKMSRHLFGINTPPLNKINKRPARDRSQTKGRRRRGVSTRSGLFYSGPCVL